MKNLKTMLSSKDMDWHIHLEGGKQSSATGDWRLCEVCSKIKYYEQIIKKYENNKRNK